MQHQQLREEMLNEQPEQSIVAANKALLAAIKENSLEKVKLAITPEINLDAYVLEMTFLQYAILTKASTAIIELLIEKGAEINRRDEKQIFTPFHYAVMTGNKDAIQCLHAKKTNIHEKSESQSALHLACQPGTYKNKSINVYAEYDLESQTFPINSAVISLLLQFGLDVNDKDDDGATPLHYLTLHNHLDGVRILLENAGDMHAKNTDGITALHLTAQHNLKDTKIAELLIERDNTILSNKDNNNHTALHTACYNANLNLVKLFIKKGMNVNERLAKGNTALHINYEDKERTQEFKEIIQLILDAGADINAVNDDGVTPLHLAAYYMHNAELIKLFIENKANTNALTPDGMYSPLFYAVEGARIRKATMLAKHYNVTIEDIYKNKQNIMKNGIPEIFIMDFNKIDRCYMHTTKALLDCGADIYNEPIVENDMGKEENILLMNSNSILANKPLMQFIRNKIKENKPTNENKIIKNTDKSDYEKYIKEMEPITDINFIDIEGCTCLHKAVRFGDVDTVKFLLSVNAKVNTQNNIGDTPLHDAVIKGNKEIVKLLIESGANLEAKNYENNTPFHIAINSDSDVSPDRVEIIKLLVAKGSDIKSLDGDGYSCVSTAASRNHSEMLNLLIELGADVNAPNSETKTAMHIAAHNGCIEIVKMLLANKARFNIKDKNLSIPLLDALRIDDISPNHFAIVKLLIDAGADITTRDKEGFNALHLAVQPNDEIVDSNVITENHALVEFLLSKNKELINTKTKDKQTPLHLASMWKNNTKIINLLIKHGANINAITQNNATPLIYAVDRADNLEVVKLLIANKATIDVKDRTGATPLHRAAAIRKNEKVVAYLLEKGAKVNVKLDKYITPLHRALQATIKEKEDILTTYFKDKTIEEILDTENLEPFKETFKQIDQDYFATATTLIAHGADLNLEFKETSEMGVYFFNLNQPLINKLIIEYIKKIKQEKSKNDQKAKKVSVEATKTPEEIEKEKEIVRKKEQKKLEQQELQKKQAEEKARLAAESIHETIAKMFANTTIEFTYDETKKSYTFKFKTNDSYQAFKTIFKNHQQLKNTKLQFSGLSISFTEDEAKLKKAFKEDNNFISRLKDIIEKNIVQKEESPKTITQAEAEAEWDTAFKAHWQTYLKSIFPFDITVETNIDDLALTMTFNQFSEKAKTFYTLLQKFFAVDGGTREAQVTYKDNKIIIKPLNKPSYNSYKDIAQPTFEKTSDLKALINKELNSNNTPTPSTTSQILGKTNTPQKIINKKPTSDNNNANTEPPKEEDKEAFKAKIKAFMNHISENILTDKLNYFKITRINQNLSRIEMQFDVKAYSSFATNTTPTGSMEFLTKMKQAVNKVLGQDVMTFDEKENSIKFFFSKVDKAELFKKQDEIRKVFNELNTEVENEIKISDGKQEIKTDNNNADAATNNDVFTVNNLFNEIHQILARVKNNPEKNKNLLTLLKVLNNYSPSKNASDDVILFHAYKLLATYTLNALSQEHYAENHLPHMYNLRSITRHAYDVYEWQDFHQLFSPFFKQLEAICIQIFNSTTDATPILFKQKNSLLPHVTSLNDELNLFAPLLTEGLLKGNLPIADINSFEAQIASLKADLNNNDLSEKTIKTIQFAILQLCCQIGESADKSKKLEKEIYGELHKPNLKNDPFEILNKLFQRYLFPANENKKANVNMKM